MDTSHRRRRTPWLPAMLTSLLLVLGSLLLAAPASADPSPQGKTAPGHAHKPAKKSHPTKVRSSDKPTTSGSSGSSGSSGVSLPRPNDFQAQADPDGMTNGGVDQPGGQGGVDTTSQDGNNGSGNDADCEDDNRGVGVPGHCKDRTPEPPGTPDVPGTDVPGSDAGGPVPTTPEDVLTVVPSVVPSVVTVSAPTLTPEVTAVDAATTTAVRSSAGQAAPATGPSVLPNTGAGRAMLALALAGLAALAVGGGFLRQGRRTATP